MNALQPVAETAFACAPDYAHFSARHSHVIHYNIMITVTYASVFMHNKTVPGLNIVALQVEGPLNAQGSAVAAGRWAVQVQPTAPPLFQLLI
jgi:hypothetical protein